MQQAPATASEEIGAFLERYAETSMFPLGNLRRYGMRGGHPYAITAFVRRDAAGALTDVATLTASGFLNPQCPTGPWPALAAALAGQTIAGTVGPASQVRPMLVALGLAQTAMTVDRDEPFLRLGLADMTVPEGPGQIVPLDAGPKRVLLRWMADYVIEALGLPPAMANARALEDHAAYASRRSHVVLMDGETPLAMTGFNAVLPRVVQIGGVFTPVALRGRSYARRALALHLAQARAAGVERSVLSAASPQARRAYQALGYRHTDDWSLCLFQSPQEVGA